jgi:hypothetical protein
MNYWKNHHFHWKMLWMVGFFELAARNPHILPFTSFENHRFHCQFSGDPGARPIRPDGDYPLCTIRKNPRFRNRGAENGIKMRRVFKESRVTRIVEKNFPMETEVFVRFSLAKM